MMECGKEGRNNNLLIVRASKFILKVISNRLKLNMDYQFSKQGFEKAEVPRISSSISSRS